MIKLISNKIASKSHKRLLADLLSNATEVYIAVAFLKKPALSILLPYFEKPIKFKILTGYNFGITDPDALTSLLSQSIKSKNISAYLVNLDLKQTFHPKIYMIKNSVNCHVIIGLANFTNGGLFANNEVSFCYECSTYDPVWIEVIAYFNDCIDKSKADLLSERIISIYRTYYKTQKNLREKAKKFPDVDSNMIYDLNKLKFHYKSLNKKETLKAFEEKTKKYYEAKKILNEIIEKKHSSKDFNNLIEKLVGKSGASKLWDSNGMHRHKADIFKQQIKFMELIKSIKNNLNESPGFVFSLARQIAHDIKGIGPNFIGEIMMTYAPEKFANINQNPITVLRKEGDVDIKPKSSSYDGQQYEIYNTIIREIVEKLGLRNMFEIDYFFNTIYQKIKHST